MFLAISQPPWSIWWLAWIGLVPVLVACRGKGLGGRLVLGLACGTVWAWMLVGVWLWPATNEALSVGPGAGFALTLFAVELFGGLYLAVFLSLLGPLRRLSRIFAPFSGAALWVALELARAHLFGGYPWGLLGHTQWGRVELIQLADLTGAYGVSFLLAACNIAIADLFTTVRRRVWRWDYAASFGLVVLLVVGAVLYGERRLANAEQARRSMRVQIVQTAFADKDLGEAQELLRDLIQLTSRTPAEGAEIVVWPENSIRFYVQRTPAAQEAIRNLLRPRRQYLVAGGPYFETDGSGWVYRNSAYLFDREGRVVARHDKTLLVPLAEEALGALPSVERSFRPGGDPRPLVAGRRRIGVLICFEAIYARVARQLVRRGATLLINVTNDQLIGAGADQQAAMAVFRTVENRVPLVRVSNLGPSMSVDPFGRVTTSLSAASQSSVWTVFLGAGVTTYNRFGDVFAVGCALISLFSFALCALRARTSVRT